MREQKIGEHDEVFMQKTTIVDTIKALDKPAIVTISGFGGSGKSTFARSLSSDIDAPIIAIDSFWKSTDQVAYQRWEIIDFGRLVRDVFKPFLAGTTTLSFGVFDWEQNAVNDVHTVQTKGIILVEGVGLFRPELLDYFSCTIWIDCPIDVAVARGKRRDREEYGMFQDEKWDGIWRENDLQYYQAFLPMEHADFIVDTTK